MIDLFGDAGEAALARLATIRTLYAFDFDGTLAPIVARPDDARASARTVALLSRLGSLVPTALVTGRGIDDLKQRIPFTPKHLIGNHGAEGLPDALHRSLADSLIANGGNDDHRAVVRDWLGQWTRATRPWPAVDGIHVEPKAFSLSIHYRSAPDPDAARAWIDAAIAELAPPPRVIGGKFVVNLLPEGAPDKGHALTTLVRHERCDAAFFIGDDVTDESVFVVAPADWVTVVVGRSTASAARYFIERQEDIERCLETLVRHAESTGSSRR